MFQANCYNVMIVSPSDIVKEREIVRKALYHWNELNSKSSNIIFLASGYDINAHPDSGTHPQESLNHQLLERADLLIAIFWTKLGSPTSEYPSGSVEEITRHINAGKKALIYFSSKPIDPSKIDKEQYERLEQYKKSIQNETYHKTFKSDEEFERIVLDDIQLKSHELSKGLLLNKSQLVNDQSNSFTEKELNVLKRIKDESNLSFDRVESGNALLDGRYITDPREIVELEEAINMLENRRLIESRLYNHRHIYNLTAEGYRAYDKLENEK